MADEETTTADGAATGSKLALLVRRAGNLPDDQWNDDRIAAIKSTCTPAGTTNAQFAIFLATAHKYDLNPLTREIWLASMNGKLVVVTGRDAFVKVMNNQPDFEGMITGTVYETDEYATERQGDKVVILHKTIGFSRGRLIGAFCVLRRRGKPDILVQRTIEQFKHLSGKDVWKNYPDDMLTTRCIVSAARQAYNLAGLEEQTAAEDVAANAPDPSAPIATPGTGAAQAGTMDTAAELRDRLKKAQGAPTFTPPAGSAPSMAGKVEVIAEAGRGAPGGVDEPDFEVVEDGQHGEMSADDVAAADEKIRFEELNLLQQDNTEQWEAAVTRMKADDPVLYERYMDQAFVPE